MTTRGHRIDHGLGNRGLAEGQLPVLLEKLLEGAAAGLSIAEARLDQADRAGLHRGGRVGIPQRTLQREIVHLLGDPLRVEVRLVVRAVANALRPERQNRRNVARGGIADMAAKSDITVEREFGHARIDQRLGQRQVDLLSVVVGPVKRAVRSLVEVSAE